MAEKKNSECGLRWRAGQWYMHAKIDGRKYEKRTGTTVRALARARRQLWVAELRSGTPEPTGRAIRFDEFVELYRERVASRLKSYERSLRYQLDQLARHFKQLRVRDLRRHHVDDLRHELLTGTYRRCEGGEERTRGAATANRYTALLQTMVGHALQWGLIERRHADEIRTVKLTREENERMRRLSDGDVDRLLGCCTGELYVIATIAIFAGLRKSEILRLRWRDVDLGAGQLNIPRTKSGRPRSVPLAQPVREVLQMMPRRIDGGKLFRCADIKSQWQAVVRRAGFEDLRFHDLRHTFASNCAMAGATEATLATLLGHTSTRMTKRYTHLAESHLQLVVDAAARRVADGRQQDKKEARH